MSKKVQAMVRCPNCGYKQNIILFRSVWIEDPENIALILNDQINMFQCDKCNHTQRLDYPFLCTDAKKRLALWYEPYNDSQIDSDIEEYRRHMGADSYLAKAQRIDDWARFKAKLLEMKAVDCPPDQRQESTPSKKLFRGFMDYLKDKNPRSERKVNSSAIGEATPTAAIRKATAKQAELPPLGRHQRQLTIRLPKEPFLTLQVAIMNIPEEQINKAGLSADDRNRLSNIFFVALRPWLQKGYENIPDHVNVTASVSEWLDVMTLLRSVSLPNASAMHALLLDEELETLNEIIGGSIKSAMI